MTTSDRYSVLTHIGPGTPMGRYMRFFWHPIAAVEELKDHPKPVRILGEDLVLFRTTNGKLGLVAQRCAHRSASLGCGMIEDDGIRCAYHAWKYDLTGQCVDIPSERGDRKVSSRIKIPGYQVHEAGGLIWGYLGARPAPLFPRYEFIVGEQYDHDVGLSELPCNWLQIAENNMDPAVVRALIYSTNGAPTQPEANTRLADDARQRARPGRAPAGRVVPKCAEFYAALATRRLRAALALYIAASALAKSSTIEAPECGYSETPMLVDICSISGPIG